VLVGCVIRIDNSAKIHSYKQHRFNQVPLSRSGGG
jgi:hypothetical protein